MCKLAMQASMEVDHMLAWLYTMEPNDAKKVLLWRPTLTTNAMKSVHFASRCKFYIPLDTIWAAITDKVCKDDITWLCDMVVDQLQQGVHDDCCLLDAHLEFATWAAIWLDREDLFTLLLGRDTENDLVTAKEHTWVDIVGSTSQNARINNVVKDATGTPLVQSLRLLLSGKLRDGLDMLVKVVDEYEHSSFHVTTQVFCVLSLCLVGWPEEAKKLAVEILALPEMTAHHRILRPFTRMFQVGEWEEDEQITLCELPLIPPPGFNRRICEVVDYESTVASDTMLRSHHLRAFARQSNNIPYAVGRYEPYVSAGIIPEAMMASIACKFYNQEGMKIYNHNTDTCIFCECMRDLRGNTMSILAGCVSNGYVNLIRCLRDCGYLPKEQPAGFSEQTFSSTDEMWYIEHIKNNIMVAGKYKLLDAILPADYDMTKDLIDYIISDEATDKLPTIRWISKNRTLDLQRISDAIGSRIKWYSDALTVVNAEK